MFALMSPTALITGATGGMGLELAKLFAKDRHDLVLVARGREELAQLKDEFEKDFGISVKTIEKDLSNFHAPDEIYQELKKEAVRVDILVNNAGFGNFGHFVATDLKAELDMIQVNITSLTHLTKLFLKEMVQNKCGKILNVASTAAFQPGPLMAVYYATKAYVLSFSEALANEVKGTGVSVTALCPGPTRTGFQKRAELEKNMLISGALAMDAETVAGDGYRALFKNKPVVISGFMNKVIAFSIRLTPRRLVTRAIRRLQENRK